MRRFAVISMLALAAMGATGCGPGRSTTPTDPNVDNREAEVKEADDDMVKRAQQINSGRRP